MDINDKDFDYNPNFDQNPQDLEEGLFQTLKRIHPCWKRDLVVLVAAAVISVSVIAGYNQLCWGSVWGLPNG